MLSEIQRTDVHQHLWPAELIEALRQRSEPPMMRGWTLYTDGEPPFEVSAGDHDVQARAGLDAECGRVLLSLSTPLGIEALAPNEAQPLLDAWHRGVNDLPAPFLGWAAVSEIEPDLDGLKGLLTAGFVGVQVSAAQLMNPTSVEACAPVLALCEALNRPVLVHPGPVRSRTADLPPWWAAVVDYPAQLQAAWWAWHCAGRSLFPELRICFVAGAGLAPLQHERFTARSGGRLTLDRNAFVDTSSYASQGINGLTRALDIDVIVLGSDRPYAEPAYPHLAEAAQFAICAANPNRLLEGDLPAHTL